MSWRHGRLAAAGQCNVVTQRQCFRRRGDGPIVTHYLTVQKAALI